MATTTHHVYLRSPLVISMLVVLLTSTLLLIHFFGATLSTFLTPVSIRVALLCVLGGTLGVAGTFLAIAFYIVLILTRPKCQEPFIPINPFVLDLPAEEVAFPPTKGDYLVNGWYIPHLGSTTTILICPGYRRTMKDVLGMCNHLWKDGHTILVFEYYGHGKIVGTPVTLGFREINDFLGAVTYAKTRMPSTRLGALGYSMGAAISIMGSARTSEVEAVVADSAFASNWSAIELAVHRTLHLSRKLPGLLLRILYVLTDLLLSWQAGYHLHQVEPVREISQIAPRPLFLIHGMQDTVVDPLDAHQLYEAARSPKTLWLLPETKHIQAYFTDSTTYITKISDFFNIHLKHSSSSAHAQSTRIASAHMQSTSLVPIIEKSSQRTPAFLSPSCVLRRSNTRSFVRGDSTILQQRRHTRRLRLRSVPTSRPVLTRRQHLGRSYASITYRFRWPIIAIWLIALIASLPFANKVETVLHNNGYSIAGSTAQLVSNIMTNRLHQPATQLLLVLQATQAKVSSQAYQREISAIVVKAHRLPNVMTITQGTIGNDGKSTFLVIGFDENKDDLATHIPAMRQTLLSNVAGPAHLSLTGDAAIASDIELTTQADTQQAERIALPLTLLVLLLVFGSVVAGLIPLLMAGVAVPTALAVVYMIALHVETNIFSQSLVSIIGLGLSIDYSLFIVRRYREELALGNDISTALAHTMTSAGEAILFSAVIVVVGFAGLLLIGIEIMSSFAIGGVAVASISAISALTLLPAILGVLGTRINSLRVPSVAKWLEHLGHRSRTQGPHFWQHWALFVMRRSVPIIILVLIVLIVLGWPAKALNPGLNGADALPQGAESRQALQILSGQFPKENFDPLIVLVQTNDGSSILAPNNLKHLQTLTTWIEKQSHVVDVISLTHPPQMLHSPALTETQLLHLYSSGQYRQFPALRILASTTTRDNTTILTIKTNTISGNSEDQKLIDQLRSIDSSNRRGFTTLVGGNRVINMDFMRVLYGNFIRTLLFIVAATFLILLLTFRSILLPLKAILMNILSIAASYGVLTFVFQNGHFQSQLNFTSDGIIDRFIPPLLFCVLFGLSMDYEVFLLSRIKEEWDRTHDNQKAVALGVEKTAGIISNAALLFTIISTSFVFTSLLITKQLGFGLAVSVLLDATIIRLLLVPATMQLLGRWNWWFPALRTRKQQYIPQRRKGARHYCKEIT